MLRFDQVDVSINGVQILRNISFAIEPTETIAMIGRNGAGKTTTLRSVMGFTEVQGRIAFDNNDLAAVRPSDRPYLRACL